METPYSGNPTIAPFYMAMVDQACLAFFIYFRYFKTKWGMSEKKLVDSKRNTVLLICFCLVFLDNIVAMVFFTRPFVSELLRPIVFGSFLHLIRVNARQFYHDVKDSASILVAIFLFIGFYGLIGHFLFRYKFEGYLYFESIGESFYNMMILMTTANFPDVMLPVYKENFWWMLFFVSYLVVGLYFLMSFLLANVFNKFKDRLENQANKIHD